MTYLERTTVTELAAEYRAAIDRGDLTAEGMYAIAFNAGFARRGDCRECWPPCRSRYRWAMRGAALREATRGES
ncbi:MAG: hypothetical protein ACRDPY_08630 [Streptosporangiaceae bacterium]